MYTAEELRQKLMARMDALLGTPFLIRGENRNLMTALRGYVSVMPVTELDRVLDFLVRYAASVTAIGALCSDKDSLSLTPEPPSGQGVALLQERLTTRMANREDELAGFDPITIIMAIIGIIISLIQGCAFVSPAQLKVRLGNRALIALGLKRAIPGLSWRQCFREADEVFDLADSSTIEERQALIDDCR